MSDNGNNLPEIPFGNRDDANVMASKAFTAVGRAVLC